MKESFIKELINFGLSDKEAKIYVSLLELEAATVFEIAKHSGINRSSAYVVLESLTEKGFSGFSDDKKVRRYVAASPEILLQSARREAKKHEDVKTGIETILPELKALHKDTRRKPVVKVFEGKNGLISTFEDTFSSKEKVMRVASAADKIYNLLPDYFPQYLVRRVKKGIKMYGIHPMNEAVGALNVISEKMKLDEPIVIPKEKYNPGADLAIYDDKIGYMTADDGGFAVIIESKEIAEVMKSIFDLAFEEAKRLNKELMKKLSQTNRPKN